MLLRFFRINDPYRLLGILVVMILISLPLFMDPASIMLDELKMFVLGEILNESNSLYTEALTKTPPLFAWISGWFEMLFGRSVIASRILSLALIFFQLTFFSIILINNRAYNENTYLPGLVFGVLALFSYDLLIFSKELVASTVLLFALNNLFKEIEFRIQRDETLLNLGIYLGVASLMAFSFALYLPGVIMILAIFTRLSVRKFLLVLFGFVLPHSLLMILYFWKGNYAALIENYYLANIYAQTDANMTVSSLLVVSVVPSIFLLFSLFVVNREARLTKYQSQLSQVMFLWILISIAEIVISGSIKPNQLITLVPPFTYFISHYILLIRKKRMAELAIWCFLITINVVLYISRYEVLKSVSYANLYPAKTSYSQITNRYVLILSEDWGLLENNQPATGFYDWQLSKPVFDELNYFHNIILIEKAFAKRIPDVIVDENKFMDKAFVQIPKLGLLYRREGDLYIRK